MLCVYLGGRLLAATQAGQQVVVTLHFALGGHQTAPSRHSQMVNTIKQVQATNVEQEQHPVLQRVALPSRPVLLPPPPVVLLPQRPQVAIVIDDLGWDRQAAEALLALDLPLSFAILPTAPYQTYIAQEAQRRGRDVLLHLPMEPYGYPQINPGHDALLSHMPTDELTAHLERALQALPSVVGVNNHMGSRLTENRAAMRVVMQHLKQHNLFFLDSRTSQHSLAYRIAREMGVRAAQRHIFLDHEVRRDTIAKRLYDLVALANTHGQAIGIGHPYPETLQALRQILPTLYRSGVEIVPVSHLVQ
jgi:polysaccharide deacetylase 2 family uncharacterized protein YibQ